MSRLPLNTWRWFSHDSVFGNRIGPSRKRFHRASVNTNTLERILRFTIFYFIIAWKKIVWKKRAQRVFRNVCFVWLTVVRVNRFNWIVIFFRYSSTIFYRNLIIISSYYINCGIRFRILIILQSDGFTWTRSAKKIFRGPYYMHK